MPRTVKKQTPEDAGTAPEKPAGPLAVETCPVDRLKPHPRNYRVHPEDELEHIRASLRSHGFYRPVVVAADYTILAGHGVVQAAKAEGLPHVPVVVLPLEPDSPAALKVLTGDNEIAHLCMADDRALSELLKEIADTDLDGLLGTGYDPAMLAALVFVTRPASEIPDQKTAGEWAGMPGYEEGDGDLPRLIITFPDDEARQAFLEQTGVRIDKNAIKGRTWSTRWPWTDRVDTASIRFVGTGPEE